MAAERSAWLSIGADPLRAQIDPLGAQLSRLRDAAGRDLLWDGDPAVWSGRAPLLFPIVGALAGGVYRVHGKRYAMPRHGFARGKPFEVLSVSPSSAALLLRADEATLQLFPFRFELEMRFAIEGPALDVTALIRNVGTEPMPASFGFHPAFRWPLPYGAGRAEHFIEFEADERAPIRRLDTAGLVTPLLYPNPIRQRRLVLDDALFKEDAIILDAIRSRSVSYGTASGPRIRVDFPHTPYLGLWSKPGAGLICIEPWHGLADPVGFDGELGAKPGMILIAPDAEIRIGMQIAQL